MDLQLASFRDCDTANELEMSLSSLPETLGDTYRQILKRVAPRKMNRIYQVLAWVLYSKVPLKLEHFPTVYALEPGELIPDKRDLPSPSESILSLYSGLLVKIDEASSKYRSGYYTALSLAHFSVKDHFVEMGHEYKFGDYDLTADKARQFIADTCLSILTPRDLGTLQWLHDDEDTLCDYAAVFCLKHVTEVTGYDKMLDRIQNLFNPNLPHFNEWSKWYTKALGVINCLLHPFDLECWAELNRWTGDYYRRGEGGFCSPLHIATHCRLFCIVDWLITNCGVDVNTTCKKHDEEGKVALYCACDSGNEEISKHLLKQGALSSKLSYRDYKMDFL